MSSVKKKRTFFSIIARVVDVLVYPIIIISFMSSFFMIVAKSKNAINPIFGRTFARVLSNSMSYYCKEAGRIFLKGDIAILKTGKAMYEVGDIIGFYYYNDPADNTHLFNLTTYESKELEKLDENGNVVMGPDGQPVYVHNKYVPVVDENGKAIFNQELLDTINNCEVGESFIDNTSGSTYQKIAPQSNRKTVAEVQEGNTPIYFHQIVQIKVDAAGTIYYITKGTANAEKDTYEIRHDFVVGEYVSTPKFLSGLVNFCASTEGMIMLVVAPIAIVVLVELLSILEQINNILLERKVINREIPFDSKECIKANIGIEMRNADKVYYYDVMPPEYKEDVYEYLWGYLRDNKSKRYKNIFETSQSAISVYDMEDPSLYYATWKESTKNQIFKNQLYKAEKKSEVEKYADVVFIDYQNYLDGEGEEYLKDEEIEEDIQVEEKPKKSRKSKKVATDEIVADNGLDEPSKQIDVEQKLKEVDEKLEKTKELENKSNQENANTVQSKSDTENVNLQDDNSGDTLDVAGGVQKHIDIEQKLKEVDEKLERAKSLQKQKSKTTSSKSTKEGRPKKPTNTRSKKKSSTSKKDISKKLEEVENMLKEANESLKSKDNNKDNKKDNEED